MNEKRRQWILNYRFAPDYPSEQSWQAAFSQFCVALREFDKSNH
jgi:hypothetical protein